MTLGEKMDRRYEDGLRDGEIKGEINGELKGKACINKLNQFLRQQGRLDDLFKAMDDSSYQAQLLKEFGLEN